MPQRKKPIRSMSKKTRAKIPARKAAMEVVRERDAFCQLPLRLVVWAANEDKLWGRSGAEKYASAVDAFEVNVGECSGPLDGHEPVHRSQGGDPTDPDAIVLLCRAHHDFCHEHPSAARDLGL